MEPITILGIVAASMMGTVAAGVVGRLAYFQYKLYQPTDWSKEPVVPWS